MGMAARAGKRRAWKRRAALVTSVILATQVMFGLQIVEAAVYSKGEVWKPSDTKVSTMVPVPGTHANGPVGKAVTAPPAEKAYQVPKVALPAAGSVEVALGTAGADAPAVTKTGVKTSAAALVQAGSAPVYLGSGGPGTPAKVNVQFADRTTALKAGDDGLLLTVSRADGGTAAGAVAVAVDPAALAGLYGGGFADRLEWFEVPECALTTPAVAACQVRIPVKTTQDPATGRLVADVTLPAVSQGAAPKAVSRSVSNAGATSDGVVALTADSVPAGSAGTYTATSVKVSDQWSAGGSTGDFSYSYPISSPPTIGGTAPNVALSYSSSSVDGETVSTNEQSSGIGDGWDYDPGFIERSYQPCSQDGMSGSGDNCWAYGGHEITASGSGIAGQVVWDDTSKSWKMAGSDATVQLLQGASNGSYDGEYWVVTDPDGTQYYYGAGKLPTALGGTGSDVATNSAWTEPVYCPTTGDLCNSSSTGQSSVALNMAYRWNLDYVVDPQGNTTVYDYATETNYYARGSAHTLTPYTRDGYLTQISYGWRTSDIASEAAHPAPADEIRFTNAQRCVGPTSTCSSYSNLNSTTAPDWVDTPYDLNCNAGVTNCLVASETHWSTYMATQIQTLVNEGTTSASSYMPVDTYAFNQSFPAPGDGTSPALQLNSILHTGADTSTGTTGGAAQLPLVTFLYAAMANRVPGSTMYPAFDRYRITAIDTEAGGVINIAYTNTPNSFTPACNQTAGSSVLPTPSSDTMLCYEEYWTPPTGGTIADWFEKYVVSSVTQSDPTGGSPTQVTQYGYVGTTAWHRNDSPFILNAQRTWDEFRGFQKVTIETGTAPDPVTETETTFLRGMDGDYESQTGGAQRSVTVTTTMGDVVTDSNQYAGTTLETQTFSAANGTSQLETESIPWSTVVATHAETGTGVPPETVYFTGTAETKARSILSTGAWRTTESVNVYNPATGEMTQTDNEGDLALVGTAKSQETCQTVQYAPAPAAAPQMISMPARRIVVAVTTGGPVGSGTCPAETASNAVSDATTFYDGNSSPGVLGSAQSVGEVTETQTLKSWSGTTPVYQTQQSANAYDAYGRLISTTTALGEVTSTTYAPATGVLPTSVAVKDVTKGWTTTTTLEQARQLATKTVDQNNNATSEKYDGLGRILKVWQPGRSVLQSASREYTYNVNGLASPTTVETLTLRDDNTYAADYEIYDGFMQPRQDQTVSLDGTNGSLVTDTFYNTDGWVSKASSPYYISAYPSSSLFQEADSAVPEQIVKTYDGRGRVITSADMSYANLQSSTNTSYPGAERTDVVPPTGGTPSSTFTEATGSTVAVWDFTGGVINDSETYVPGASAPADATQIAYTSANVPGGVETTTTDTSGHVWTDSYDYSQNMVASTDPDSDSATATYDPAGDVLTETSDNGTRTVANVYDVLGRKVDEYSGSTSGPLMASWTFDTAPGGIGYPATSTSYDSAGNAYVQTVTGYNGVYAPTGESVSIPSGLPAAEAKLAGTYPQSMTYTANKGLLATTTYGTGDTANGGEGGLPNETVTNTYSQNGVLGNVAGTADYLTAVQANPFGVAIQTTMGDMPKQVVASEDIDSATGRVVESFLDAEGASAHIDDISTTWNPAGLITSTKDVQNGGTSTDLQCYAYSSLDQLAAAWSDTSGTSTAPAPSFPGIGGCNTTSPTAATVGGPAPYWQSYTYNPDGDRATETDHNLAGNAAANVTHTYAYPSVTGTTGAPNELGTVTTETGTTQTGTDHYTYNPDGSVSTRVLAAGPNQTFTYDAAGRTKSVVDSSNGSSSSYLYDASGNLLLETDVVSGATTVTLYLPGEQLTLNTGTQAESGLRYYSAGAITEVRSSSGDLTYESGNSQNTQTTAVDAGSLAVTRQYFTPSGAVRSPAPSSWVDNRGFLNQPTDAAIGLDVLGVRLYDPSIGRFEQRDSVFEGGDAQQIGGYTYADNDPVNGTDPSGLMLMGPHGACGSPASCAAMGGGSTDNGNDTVTVTKTPKKTGSVTVSVTGSSSDHCAGTFDGPMTGSAKCGTVRITFNAPKYIIVNGQQCSTAACQTEADSNFQQIAAIADDCASVSCVESVMGDAETPEQLTMSATQAQKDYGIQPPKPRCTGFWGCTWHDIQSTAKIAAPILAGISTWASYASFIPGVGQYAEAISVATGLLSAGMYGLAGEGEDAAQELAGTAVSIFAGGIGKIPGEGHIADTFADLSEHVGGIPKVEIQEGTQLGVSSGVKVFSPPLIRVIMETSSPEATALSAYATAWGDHSDYAPGLTGSHSFSFQ